MDTVQAVTAVAVAAIAYASWRTSEAAFGLSQADTSERQLIAADLSDLADQKTTLSAEVRGIRQQLADLTTTKLALEATLATTKHASDELVRNNAALSREAVRAQEELTKLGAERDEFVIDRLRAQLLFVISDALDDPELGGVAMRDSSWTTYDYKLKPVRKPVSYFAPKPAAEQVKRVYAAVSDWLARQPDERIDYARDITANLWGDCTQKAAAITFAFNERFPELPVFESTSDVVQWYNKTNVPMVAAEIQKRSDEFTARMDVAEVKGREAAQTTRRFVGSYNEAKREYMRSVGEAISNCVNLDGFVTANLGDDSEYREWQIENAAAIEFITRDPNNRGRAQR